MPVKSQSAMEYLMTYGWAILIIAIVLVALFQLGLFGNSNLEPRVPAGACHVYRSVQGASNVGECSGVWPQFVAQFNGQSSVAELNAQKLTSATFVGWIDLKSFSSGLPIFIFDGVYLFVNSGSIFSDSCGLYYVSTGDQVPCNQAIAEVGIETNEWVMVAYTLDSSGTNTAYSFVNGVEKSNSASFGQPVYIPATQMQIGDGDGSEWFNGLMSNIQIYNTSLSSNELNALYLEGIAGAPIDPNNIIDWWPLNGNMQDYSGNGNEATATAVTYTGAWTSWYTQP